MPHYNNIMTKHTITVAIVILTCLVGIKAGPTPDAISSIMLTNYPCAGGGTITMLGTFNNAFGHYSIGVNTAMTTAPTEISSTSWAFKVPASAGDNLDVAVNTNGVAYFTLSNAFSYDDAVFTGIVRRTYPLTGGVSLTVLGVNFGAIDQSPGGKFGGTAFGNVNWNSDSSISCKIPSTATQTVDITMSIHLADHENLMTFTRSITAAMPFILGTRGTNYPITGGQSLTISGKALSDIASLSERARYRSTGCEAVDWVSSSGVKCKGAAATSSFAGGNVILSIFSAKATVTSAVTADTPLIKSITDTNFPVTGAESLTFMGINFARSTPKARGGGTAAEATSWISISSVATKVPAGAADAISTILTASKKQTLTKAYTIDTGMFTSLLGSNAPTSGSVSLTIFGKGITYVNTLNVRIGSTAAPASDWVSGTSVRGKTPLAAVYTSPVTITDAFSHPKMTITNAITFNWFTIQSAVPVNAGSSGGGSLTVSGVNFGMFMRTAKVRVATACTASAWISDSNAVCKLAAGSSGYQNGPISVTILKTMKQSITNAVTFNMIIFSAITRCNFPTTGGASLTLYGGNLGSSSISATTRVGGTAFLVTSWLSDNCMLAKTPAAVFQDLPVVATVFKTIKSITNAVTADVQWMSNVLPTNRPQTGSASLTYLGARFNQGGDRSIKTRLMYTNTEASQWISDSCIVVRSPAGDGGLQSSIVTMLKKTSTFTRSVSYDAPVFTSLARVNAPVTGSASLTAYGSSFGILSKTQQVRIGKTAAAASVWISFTTVTAKTAGAPGANVVLTVTRSLNSLTNAMSLDIPIFTSYSPSNSPTSGSVSLTVYGTGVAVQTAKIRVGGSAAESTLWVSFSSLSGKMSAGLFGNRDVTITYASRWSLTSAITFNTMSVTLLAPTNSPSSGTSMMISGSMFGRASSSSKARVGGSPCVSSGWISDSTIGCRISMGSPGQQGATVIVTLARGVSTLTKGLTFDSMQFTQVPRTNSISTGGASLTLYGCNFGTSTMSGTGRLGGTGLPVTTWISDSSLVTRSPSVSDTGRSAVVTMVNNMKTITNAVTADVQWMSNVLPTNRPQTGATSLTYLGARFNQGGDRSIKTRLTYTNAEASQWISDSCVLTKLPAGDGGLQSSIVTMLKRVSTFTRSVSYDAPVVTSLAKTNLPVSGAVSITVYGIGLGVISRSQLSRIGGTMALNTAWVSLSIITAKAPPTSQVSFNVALSTSASVGTLTLVVSTDLMSMTSPSPVNVPSTGSLSLALVGSNVWVRSPRVRVGGSGATVTSWISQSSVYGKTAAGVSTGRLTSITNVNSMTISTIISFDLPLLRSVVGSNSPVGGTVQNFIGVDYPIFSITPTVRVGGSGTANTVWLSATTISARNAGAAPGLRDMTAVITLGKLPPSSLTFAVTFDRVVVAGAAPSNNPSTGGVSLTIRGFNFGGRSFSATARVGPTAPECVVWISDTTVTARTAQFSGQRFSVIATVTRAFSTLSAAITCDLATFSSLSPFNRPTTGSTTLTVMGNGMIRWNQSPIAKLGPTSNEASVWTSDSTVATKIHFVEGFPPTIVTVNMRAATQSRMFSTDVAAISSVLCVNTPSTGSTSLTLLGRNNGVLDRTQKVRVGKTSAEATKWMSESGVTAKSPSARFGSEVILTLARAVGSFTSVMSSSIPMLSSGVAVNFPTTGSVSLTLLGASFYMQGDNTICTRVHRSTAPATRWQSSSSVLVKTCGGFGSLLSLEVTQFFPRVATITRSFSYILHVVKGGLPANGPTAGSSTVCVVGSMFGNGNLASGTGVNNVFYWTRFGGSAASTTAWSSDSSLAAKTAPGMSGGHSIVATILSVRSSVSQAFTFDKSVASSMLPFNVPTTGGLSLTVVGFNFGVLMFCPTSRIGGSTSPLTQWNSDSAVVVRTAAGQGVPPFAVVTVVNRVGQTLTRFLSYNAPSTSALVPSNGATTGSQSITIFGAVARVSTVSVRTGKTGGASSVWLSDSSVTCKAGMGTGVRSVSVTSTRTRGQTAVSAVSVDLPTASFVTLTNAPLVGGYTMTVLGLGMGMTDTSPLLKVDVVPATSTVWQSDTSLRARIGPGGGNSRSVFLIVDSNTGMRTNVFTFDGLSISASKMLNIPMTGAVSITLYGQNYGTSTGTVATRPARTSPENNRWKSDSYMFVKMPAGMRPTIDAVVTVGKSQTTGWMMSVELPSISSLLVSNAPSSASTSITIIGVGYASTDCSNKIRIKFTASPNTFWTSSTCVTGRLPASADGKLSFIMATVAALKGGTILSAFSTDVPYASDAAPKNTITTSSSSVTVLGTNFASTSSRVTLGSSPSESTRWLSQSCIIARVPAGTGILLQIAVTPVRISFAPITTLSRTLTYDRAALTSTVQPGNSPVTGSTTVSVLGSNLGKQQFSVSARLGRSSSTASIWTTSTTVLCKSSRSNASPIDVVIATLRRLVGSQTAIYSHNLPLLSSTNPSNGPSSGAISLTIVACSVRGWASPRGRVGGSGSSSTVWLSATSVSAKTPTAFSVFIGSITVVAQAATLSRMLTIDVGTPSSALVANQAATSSFSVTLLGFSSISASRRARIGGTESMATLWTSASALQVKTPFGFAVRPVSALTSNVQMRTGVNLLSYDAVRVTVLQGQNITITSNAGTTGSVSITLMAFSSYCSAQTRIDVTATVASVWTSESTIVCKIAGGVSGTTETLLATVNVRYSESVLRAFSISKPAVSAARPGNTSPTSSASVTIFGTGFGSLASASSPNRVGGTAQEVSKWISDTSIFSRFPKVSMMGARSIVTVMRLLSTQTAVFSIDGPQISSLQPPCAPTTGAVSITVTGQNLFYSPAFRDGSSASESTIFISLTALALRVSRGCAKSLSVMVTSTRLAATQQGIFSYSAPTVINIWPTQGPTSGGSIVTIFGTNFGLNITSNVQVLFDPSQCPSSYCSSRNWTNTCDVMSVTNDNTIVCTVREGRGHFLPVTVFVCNNNSTKNASAVWDYKDLTVANNTVITGNGTQTFVVGTPNALWIQARNYAFENRTEGGDIFGVLLNGPYSNGPTQPLGQWGSPYTANYTANYTKSGGLYFQYILVTRSGVYNIQFSLWGIDFRSMSVYAKPAAASAQSLAFGNGIQLVCGTISQLLIQARDSYANNITTGGEGSAFSATVRGPSAPIGQTGISPITQGPPVVDLLTGLYSFYYWPFQNVSGNYTITATYTAPNLQSTTLLITTVYIAPAGASAPNSYLLPTVSGVTGVYNPMVLVSRDRFNNFRSLGGFNYTTNITGPIMNAGQQTSVVTAFFDVPYTSDGKYAPTVLRTVSGTYIVQITLNGDLVFGSPFSMDIVPNVLSPSRSIAYGDLLGSNIKGLAATLMVQGRDMYGNDRSLGGGNIAVLITGEFTYLNFSMTDLGNGSYIGVSTFTISGNYSVGISFAATNGTATPISGSPYSMNVYPSRSLVLTRTMCAKIDYSKLSVRSTRSLLEGGGGDDHDDGSDVGYSNARDRFGTMDHDYHLKRHLLENEDDDDDKNATAATSSRGLLHAASNKSPSSSASLYSRSSPSSSSLKPSLMASPITAITVTGTTFGAWIRAGCVGISCALEQMVLAIGSPGDAINPNNDYKIVYKNMVWDIISANRGSVNELVNATAQVPQAYQWQSVAATIENVGTVGSSTNVRMTLYVAGVPIWQSTQLGKAPETLTELKIGSLQTGGLQDAFYQSVFITTQVMSPDQMALYFSNPQTYTAPQFVRFDFTQAPSANLTFVGIPSSYGIVAQVLLNNAAPSIVFAPGGVPSLRPMVSSMLPNWSPVDGGIAITVVGGQFSNSPLSKCMFGTVQVPAAPVNTTINGIATNLDYLLTCTSPPNVAGEVVLYITNDGTTWSQTTTRFYYRNMAARLDSSQTTIISTSICALPIPAMVMMYWFMPLTNFTNIVPVVGFEGKWTTTTGNPKSLVSDDILLYATQKGYGKWSSPYLGSAASDLLAVNQWHYVVVILEANQKGSIYVDAANQTTTPFATFEMNLNDPKCTRVILDGSPGVYLIDEVRIFETGSDQPVTFSNTTAMMFTTLQAMKPWPTTAKLRLYWQFNKDYSPTIVDYATSLFVPGNLTLPCLIPQGTCNNGVSNNTVIVTAAAPWQIPVVYAVDPSRSSVNQRVITRVTGEFFAASKWLRCRFGSTEVAATPFSQVTVQCQAPVADPISVIVSVTNDALDYSTNVVKFYYGESSVTIDSAVKAALIANSVCDAFNSSATAIQNGGITVTTWMIRKSASNLGLGMNSWVPIMQLNQPSHALFYKNISGFCAYGLADLASTLDPLLLNQTAYAPFDTWHFVGVTYDTNSNGRLYVQYAPSVTTIPRTSPLCPAGYVATVRGGAQVCAVSLDAPKATQVRAWDGCTTFSLGAPSTVTNAGAFSVDEIRTWTRVLSQSELSSTMFTKMGTYTASNGMIIANSTGSTSLYSFNEGAGTLSYSDLPQNPAILVNCVWEVQPTPWQTPAVTSVSPSWGQPTGGSVVTVTGEHFAQDKFIVCAFDTFVANQIQNRIVVLATWVSESTILCVTPPVPPRLVQIRVSDNGQTFSSTFVPFRYYEVGLNVTSTGSFTVKEACQPNPGYSNVEFTPTSQITVAAWVMLYTPLSSVGRLWGFYMSTTAPSTQPYLAVDWVSNGQQSNITFNPASTGNLFGPVRNNQWHYLVMTISGSLVKIWANQETALSPFTGTTGLTGRCAAFILGAPDMTYSSAFTIEELAIFNTLLDPATLYGLQFNPVSAIIPNPVVRFSFNNAIPDPSTSTVTGNGTTGILVAPAQVVALKGVPFYQLVPDVVTPSVGPSKGCQNVTITGYGFAYSPFMSLFIPKPDGTAMECDMTGSDSALTSVSTAGGETCLCVFIPLPGMLSNGFEMAQLHTPYRAPDNVYFNLTNSFLTLSSVSMLNGFQFNPSPTMQQLSPVNIVCSQDTAATTADPTYSCPTTTIEVTGCGFVDKGSTMVCRFMRELPNPTKQVQILTTPASFLDSQRLRCNSPPSSQIKTIGSWWISVSLDGVDFTGSGPGETKFYFTFFGQPSSLSIPGIPDYAATRNITVSVKSALTTVLPDINLVALDNEGTAVGATDTLSHVIGYDVINQDQIVIVQNASVGVMKSGALLLPAGTLTVKAPPAGIYLWRFSASFINGMTTVIYPVQIVVGPAETLTTYFLDCDKSGRPQLGPPINCLGQDVRALKDFEQLPEPQKVRGGRHRRGRVTDGLREEVISPYVAIVPCAAWVRFPTIAIRAVDAGGNFVPFCGAAGSAAIGSGFTCPTLTLSIYKIGTSTPSYVSKDMATSGLGLFITDSTFGLASPLSGDYNVSAVLFSSLLGRYYQQTIPMQVRIEPGLSAKLNVTIATTTFYSQPSVDFGLLTVIAQDSGGNTNNLDYSLLRLTLCRNTTGSCVDVTSLLNGKINLQLIQGVGVFPDLNMMSPMSGSYALIITRDNPDNLVVPYVLPITILPGRPARISIAPGSLKVKWTDDIADAESGQQVSSTMRLSALLYLKDQAGNMASGTVLINVTASPTLLSDKMQLLTPAFVDGLANFTLQLLGNRGSTYNFTLQAVVSNPSFSWLQFDDALQAVSLCPPSHYNPGDFDLCSSCPTGSCALNSLPKAQVSNGPKLFLNGLFVQSCDGNQDPGNSIGFPGRCVCKPGYKRRSGVTTCDPCGYNEYQALSNQVRCDSCPDLMSIFGAMQGDVGSDEYNATSVSQCACTRRDYYSRYPPNSPVGKGVCKISSPTPDCVCNKCPNFMTCNGGNRIVPNDGYYVIPTLEGTDQNISSDVAYPCAMQGACVNAECNEADGFTGFLCDSCKRGFGKMNQRCNACPSDAINTLALAGIGTALACVAMVLAAQAKRPKSDLNVVKKIFLNHMQVMSFVGEIRTAWTGVFSSFFQGSGYVNIGSNLVFLDCALSTDASSSNLSSKFFFFMTLPVVGAFLPVVWNMLTYGFKYGRKRLGLLRGNALRTHTLEQGTLSIADACLPPEERQVRREAFSRQKASRRREKRKALLTNCIVMSLVVIYLTFSTITKQIFQIFNVRRYVYFADDNDDATQRLEADLLIATSSVKYTALLQPAALVFMFAYCFAIPAGLLFNMMRRRKHLFKGGSTTTIFNFIISGYCENRYFWEIFILMRKLLFSMAIVFINQSNSLQMYAAMFIIDASMLITVYAKPYRHPTAQKMEIFSMVALHATLMAGLILDVDVSTVISPHAEQLKKTFITWSTMVLNFVVLAVFVVVIVPDMEFIQRRIRHYRYTHPKKEKAKPVPLWKKIMHKIEKKDLKGEDPHEHKALSEKKKTISADMLRDLRRDLLGDAGGFGGDGGLCPSCLAGGLMGQFYIPPVPPEHDDASSSSHQHHSTASSSEFEQTSHPPLDYEQILSGFMMEEDLMPPMSLLPQHQNNKLSKIELLQTFVMEDDEISNGSAGRHTGGLQMSIPRRAHRHEQGVPPLPVAAPRMLTSDFVMEDDLGDDVDGEDALGLPKDGMRSLVGRKRQQQHQMSVGKGKNAASPAAAAAAVVDDNEMKKRKYTVPLSSFVMEEEKSEREDPWAGGTALNMAQKRVTSAAASNPKKSNEPLQYYDNDSTSSYSSNDNDDDEDDHGAGVMKSPPSKPKQPPPPSQSGRRTVEGAGVFGMSSGYSGRDESTLRSSFVMEEADNSDDDWQGGGGGGRQSHGDSATDSFMGSSDQGQLSDHGF